jgi:hypothetical protein
VFAETGLSMGILLCTDFGSAFQLSIVSARSTMSRKTGCVLNLLIRFIMGFANS